MKHLLLASTALGLAACTHNVYQPLIGPPVTETPTPYTQALACLADKIPVTNRATIGVSSILDKTGKFSLDDGGYKMTQGADAMAVSALSKSGAVNLVERMETRIVEWELKYANDKVLGDGLKTVQTDKGPQTVPFRGIYPGSLTGSDYYLVGAITSLDYNIFSGGVQAQVMGIGPSVREYRMQVGIDLRLVDTRSSRIVAVSSLQKQITGIETSFGVFRFFGEALVDINAGTKMNEPAQLGVRFVVERATLDLLSKLYGLAPDGPCQSLARQAEAPPAA